MIESYKECQYYTQGEKVKMANGDVCIVKVFSPGGCSRCWFNKSIINCYDSQPCYSPTLVNGVYFEEVSNE
jgi:hypothetical protein